jgi:hypothetical protein
MDPELKAYLDERFSQVGERFSQMDERFSQMDDAIRQTRILIEGQGNDIRQVAEGVIGTNERLDSFREEMALQFDQVRSLISPPYSDLNRRVKTLESWRERTERDPVELVREKFGKPKH